MGDAADDVFDAGLSSQATLEAMHKAGARPCPRHPRIEAAALALYREAGWDVKWDNIHESGRERFRKAAQAVIDAINGECAAPEETKP